MKTAINSDNLYKISNKQNYILIFILTYGPN